jgi:putative transposase
MVEHDHPRLSISRQCQALGLARPTWHHRPKVEKATNLYLMRLVDVQFLDTPFYGSRQMRQHLKHRGITVERGRIRRLSNTMDTGFCVAALEEAMNGYGVPEIFNTDQGAQCTSQEFPQVLKDAGVAISMDGKGRWMDNVFIERLWRSVKWEGLYLRELETGSQAWPALGHWSHFYNEQRQHTAFDGRRPIDVYRDGQLVSKAA